VLPKIPKGAKNGQKTRVDKNKSFHRKENEKGILKRISLNSTGKEATTTGIQP
jgi:hypothetical protein